jgi:hypothetical protein
MPKRWDLLTFNNLCKDKYERLDLDWRLKDIPLMEEELIEALYEIGKTSGVKNVEWSGLTKGENKVKSEESSDKVKLPSC